MSRLNHPTNPNRRSLSLIAVLLISVSTLAIGITNVAAQRRTATGERVAMTHDGRERHYRIYVPKTYDGKSHVPLLFCFHGGGGTAEIASRMGFSLLAEKKGFIVVYPEGLNRHWNDGRKSQKFVQQDADVDDVAFVLALCKNLQQKFQIDSGRIYATGASNGGFFAHRLAIEASDTFAAVAIMIATMPKPFEDNFAPTRPVAILFMNGTDDPFVPYDGGPITPNFVPRLVKSQTHDFGRGEGSSTDTAVKLWVKHNGLAKQTPEMERLPDKDPRDGCRVDRQSWSGGKDGATVVLYRVKGGGHTIPGGVQYLPERIIGKTCRDLDGIKAVWKFLEQCKR
jgi:polyhydroxybutyrate depolymerase